MHWTNYSNFKASMWLEINNCGLQNLSFSILLTVSWLSSVRGNPVILYLCFNLPTKWQTLNQNEICAVLRLKRQYKQHDGEKWLCEILHIACLLNSENPIQTRTQTFIKHVLLAKVRAINRLKNTNHTTRKRQEWGGGGLIKNFCVSMRSRTRHPSLFVHYCTHKLP